MQLRVVNESDITSDLDTRIRTGLCECFPHDTEIFAHTRRWHGSGPAYSVMVDDAGFIAAHVGVVDRSITVGERPVRVAGIQNVFVRPQHRGRGLSNLMLRASMDEALRRGFDLGLLFCTDGLVPVYTRGGWIALPGRNAIRVDEAQREVPLSSGNHVMFHPLRLAAFPPGPIHLHGNDW